MHELVVLFFPSYADAKQTFEPSSVLCQFIKAADEAGYLTEVCDELMIDSVNPNLLVLDENAKHSYLTWRSGVFYDFSAAKKERCDLFQALINYLQVTPSNVFCK